MSDTETSINKLLTQHVEKIKNNPNDRLLFWEHCYGFFYYSKDDLIKSENREIFDYSALMLFAYLSSWRMLKNSFLFDYDYKIHIPLIKDLVKNHHVLWNDLENITWKNIEEADQTINDYYSQFQSKNKFFNKPAPAIRTKILSGIFGCVPTYESYFKLGLGNQRINQRFGEKSYNQLVKFYKENKEQFPQLKLKYHEDIAYPPMKLIEIYFMDFRASLSDNDPPIPF